jgi:hypothetical protein
MVRAIGGGATPGSAAIDCSAVLYDRSRAQFVQIILAEILVLFEEQLVLDLGTRRG